MAQYSGMWTLSQVSQAVKDQNWTGIAPPNIEYLIVAGGGGGGASQLSGANGAAGGDGVVIIRYPSTYKAAASSTGSPTITLASGGFNIYKFTASGSITF